MPTLLSAADAASRLGVSVRTLARYKATGALTYVELSCHNHVFREEDVDAFIAARTVQR